MQKYILLLFLPLSAVSLRGQGAATASISRFSTGIVIDGNLDESNWQTIQPLGRFTSSTPVFGETPHQQTEVRLFYTEGALYLAARCFDADQNGVRDDGAIRDDALTGDWFQISLDTWNDDQLAFDFTVSASGAQSDSRGGAGWNSRWQSAVARTADGWTLEMCIPFAALRYPKNTPTQTWGLQLTRYDRSTAQTSTWSPQNPLVADRVLQFGTLEGLEDIHQGPRNMLAVHADANYEKAKNVFFGDESALSHTLGIDGRVGINESTTLDMTLLPPVSYYLDGSFLYPDGFAWNAELPAPRQLQAEEQDLFNRGAYLNFSPTVFATDLIGRLKNLGTDDVMTNFQNSKLLHAAKLSTRTRGNWRFGVMNAVQGPVKIQVLNLGNFETRTETLQRISDYNYLTAEYLLRNTGYINISNAGQLAGPGAYSVNPTLNFRLRDRSNAYEVSGLLNYYRQQRDTQNFNTQSYNIQVARVNRKWGWRLYQNGYRYQPYASEKSHNDFSTAEVSYRNFQASSSFLNTSVRAGLGIGWSPAPGVQTTRRIYLDFSALNWNYRKIGFLIWTEPYAHKQTYFNLGAKLRRRTAMRIGGEISLSTDTRKHLFLEAAFGGASSLERELPEITASLTGTWVLNRRLTLQLEARTIGMLEDLILLPNPGRWLFERRDNWRTNTLLLLNYYPNSRLKCFAGIGWAEDKAYRREVVELQSNNELTPTTEPLPNALVQSGPVALTGVQYYFSGISQLRFRYQYGSRLDEYQLNRFFYIPSEHLADLSFIYVLGGKGRN